MYKFRHHKEQKATIANVFIDTIDLIQMYVALHTHNMLNRDLYLVGGLHSASLGKCRP